MSRIVRRTVGLSFGVLKTAIIVVVLFSVMAFLGELAIRVRLKLPNPYRSIALISLAAACAALPAHSVDVLKQKVLGAEEFEDFEDLEEFEGDELEAEGAYADAIAGGVDR